MKPTIKKDFKNTYHRDGSVSYWSVTMQKWVRKCAGLVNKEDFAAMTPVERTRIDNHGDATA